MDGAVERQRPTEVLEVHPPARRVERQLLRGQAAILDHETGLGALFDQPGLDLSLVVGARLCRCLLYTSDAADE